jgi:anti-anti-sigma factor
MDLSPRQFADAIILTPRARIDHASSEGFRDSLLAGLGPGGGVVVLDLSGVPYIASTGLRAVLVGGKQVKAQGGRLVLAGLQPSVREVFDITRFSAMFPVFPTVGEALAATSPAAAAAFAAAARP